jgi:predicted dehydrogenase
LLPEIQIVVVSTLHNSLAEITEAAVSAGKHVLVEKPAARSSSELIKLMGNSSLGKIKVRVGFLQ